jgi:RNA polymerase sigma-70 factor (ECF subfamily)
LIRALNISRGRGVIYNVGQFCAGVQLLEGVVSEETLTGTRRDRLSDDAFRALLEGRLKQVYKLAWAIAGNDEDAADSMQDALTEAWRHRASLRDPAAFEPWFGRILVNCSRNRLRHRARHRVVELDLAQSQAEQDETAGVWTRDLLNRALNRLTPEHRVVVVLRYWADLPIDEISARLGIPPGTVRSRLHYATKALRDALGEPR